MADAKPLRLFATDEVDLKIISAAIQDGVTKAGALKYQARKRRFSLELNRFRWEDDSKSRARAILAFDSVLAVRSRGLGKSDPEMVISLLAISFDAAPEAPSGVVKLLFAGDGELALDVECLDVTLLDSETVWPAKSEPSHDPRGD